MSPSFDFFINSMYESLVKFTFHDISCIKMCQREHIARIVNLVIFFNEALS